MDTALHAGEVRRPTRPVPGDRRPPCPASSLSDGADGSIRGCRRACRSSQSLSLLADACNRAGRLATAGEAGALALQCAQRAGDLPALAWAICALGNTMLARGEHHRAADLYTASRECVRRRGRRDGRGLDDREPGRGAAPHGRRRGGDGSAPALPRARDAVRSDDRRCRPRDARERSYRRRPVFEGYLSRALEVRLSHGLCPDCSTRQMGLVG